MKLAIYLVCNNTVFYNVVITPSASGIPTAGDATYSLNCSVSGMAADPATYQWFKGSADNRTLLTSDRSRTVVSNSSISQLQFSLLLASHAGLYICQATVGGVVVKGTTNVTVNCKT